MERYPLKVTIPETETVRSRMSFSAHIDYVIVIDDCGKAYDPIKRRYKTFLWLDGQLRRQNLGCSLPRLPEKRKVGNMEESFVEQRRQELQRYLEALLKSPEVIRNDSLWIFLDAEEPTMAVPRFLCRLDGPAQSADCLCNLAKVARSSGIFRLCNNAVTDELVKFVAAEANKSIDYSHGSQRPNQDPRLITRLRLCDVLLNLLLNERSKTARQLLLAANLFGALLDFLHRATEDGAKVKEIMQEQWNDDLEEAADIPRQCHDLDAALDIHKKVSDQVAHSLTVLIEQTRGSALVIFCQQDGGLERLRNLCETDRLNLAAASLLWHAIQHESVLPPLTSKAAGGILLLHKLMRSHDLKARIVAALCIGNIIRAECGLSAQERQELLDRVEQTEILHTLVQKEMDAIKQGAKNAILSTNAVEMHADSFAMPSRDFQLNPDRDAKMAGLLEWLCSEDGIRNLAPLLGGTGGNAGDGFDAISALVMAILDHHALHADVQALGAFKPLEEQLRKIVNSAAEALRIASNSPDDMAEDHTAQAMMEQGTRAARVLVRYWGWMPLHNALSTVGPPVETLPLDMCVARANALHILTQYSSHRQERSARGLKTTNEGIEKQRQQVETGNLQAPPCVPAERIENFRRKVQTLACAREDLSRKLDGAKNAMQSTTDQMDQHRVQHNTFRGDVDTLKRELDDQTVEENAAQEAASRSKTCEAVLQSAENKVREAKKLVREREDGLQRCEQLLDEAQGKVHAHEEELASSRQTLETAPKELGVARQALEEVSARHDEKVAELAVTDREINTGERNARKFDAGMREADTAIVELARVLGDIKSFRAKLNNEVVLSDAEMEGLKEMESNNKKARPSRLLDDGAPMPTSGEDAEAMLGGEEVRAPLWEEDVRREQAYRESSNCRTFAALMEHREKLWKEEKAWLQVMTDRAKQHLDRSRKTKAGLEVEVEELLQQQRQRQARVTALADQDGHRQRHDRAQDEVRGAHLELESARVAYSEAQHLLEQGRAALEESEQQRLQAEDERLKAGDVAVQKSERCRKARQELDDRIRDLLDTARHQLQDWQNVDIRREYVELLQGRVAQQIDIEKKDRDALRHEVGALIEELGMLDKQLQDVCQDAERPPSPSQGT